MTPEDALWRAWRARWDRFQEAYVPQREQQLALLADYVSLAWPEGRVQLLDLCSGPGSVGERVLEELPEAEIVALDIDPWLVELGRRTTVAGGRITWVEADLRHADWLDALPSRTFHGVLVATAMNWFENEEIERLYQHVAELLVPDGMFLVSDTAPAGTPGIQRLARAAALRRRNRETARPNTDEWPVFWREARSVPEFRELLAERDRRLGAARSFLAKSLAFHEAALSRAGFRELGEVWRCHEAAVLLARR